MNADTERLTVPVDGGDLAVFRWGRGTPTAIAAHGIASSHVVFTGVAEFVASDMTLLAPDLRGRGDSATLRGPYGMHQHARDLVAVLDHVGVDDAVIAGHSMGGFVAALFASDFPDRTRAAVLIEGGPAFMGPLSPEADVDAVLDALIGPAVDRLRRRFPDREAYRQFWREHPALHGTGVPRDRVHAYADHDAHAADGAIRSKVSADAVREDGRDSLTNDAVHKAVAAIDAPAVLLVAERGMLNDKTPLYPDDVVADLRTTRGQLEVIRVPGTNHYTICLANRGARAVAHHLRRFGVSDGEVG